MALQTIHRQDTNIEEEKNLLKLWELVKVGGGGGLGSAPLRRKAETGFEITFGWKQEVFHFLHSFCPLFICFWFHFTLAAYFHYFGTGPPGIAQMPDWPVSPYWEMKKCKILVFHSLFLLHVLL